VLRVPVCAFTGYFKGIRMPVTKKSASRPADASAGGTTIAICTERVVPNANSNPFLRERNMESTLENRLPESFQSDFIEGESQSQMGRQGNQKHAEGSVARMIEEQTAKLPSDVFLWASLGAMGVSCFLQMAGRKHESLFIGQWAPSLLILGLYNKLVKVAGSDASSCSSY
jgi:hypothetical protein